MTKAEPQMVYPSDGKLDRKLSVEQTANMLEPEATSTSEEERAVVRKIDMVVLPLMCFVFFLQYLDKQSLSYAAVCSEVLYWIDMLWCDAYTVLRYSASSRISILRLSSTHGLLRSFMLVRRSARLAISRFLADAENCTGQLVAEYPFIYLMSKFPLTKLVGITV
jgi:hypothetical protein